jgi:hypothetical protein
MVVMGPARSTCNEASSVNPDKDGEFLRGLMGRRNCDAKTQAVQV